MLDRFFVVLVFLVFVSSCSESNNKEDAKNAGVYEVDAAETHGDAFELSEAPDSSLETDVSGEKDEVALEGDTFETVSSKWEYGEIIERYGEAALSSVNTDYGKVYIIKLKGNHYEMGKQYGYLLGEMIETAWWTFMDYAAKEAGLPSKEVASALFKSVLQKAYNNYKPFMPQEYLDEIKGITDGAKEKGKTELDIGEISALMMILVEIATTKEMGELDSNLNAVMDFVTKGYSKEFIDYFKQGTDSARIERKFFRKFKRVFNISCSFFSAWGKRTEGGHLYASRNLDWTKDTGLQNYALITVYEPEGGVAYATVGYTGFIGALIGMSENGFVIGHVGSTSVLERLKAGPGTIKSRQILEYSKTMEDPFNFLGADGDKPYPNSIGTNMMVSFGDPLENGASASGAIIENNGVFTGVYIHSPDCSVKGVLYEFDYDGYLKNKYTSDENPDIVNLEENTYEIDHEGNIRKFKKDSNGNYVEDPDGEPIKVGLPLPCAFYRGDEAMMYEIRKWQIAAHGPFSGDGKGLMIESGSYKGRYKPMHDMILAWEEGTGYTDKDGNEIIKKGEKKLIGDKEAVLIAKTAAMKSNIISVAYDATGLKMFVAYESGSGDTWTPASQNQYYEFDLKELIHGKNN